MRQVLCQTSGAIVARMPRPILNKKSILVRVKYSLISTGTETSLLQIPKPENKPELTETEEEYKKTLTNRKEEIKEIFNIGYHHGKRIARFLYKTVRNPKWGYYKVKEKLIERKAIVESKLKDEDGLPINEIAHQGWNVGYSCSGEVISVGELIKDFKPGDLVACAGAGKANHADFVVIPQNLAVKVPENVSLKIAATTTVGTIALQGVRRANPLIGDKVAVIGLGLIGQITVQLLKANGCRVVGMDLMKERVEKALTLGMDKGTSNAEEIKQIIRLFTDGKGVDKTIITASTKSNDIINLSMHLTRQKGTVVIVGDVGLGLERNPFYKKEIDLLISSSYGPGRYDVEYEEEGHDYPYSYVRWTMNRNMSAYLDLIAQKKLDIESLIEAEFAVNEAAAAYKELVIGNKPLAVILNYPDEESEGPDLFNSPKIEIRGSKKIPEKTPIKFALVGAGAFGQSMLVPQLLKIPDKFALYGVVSRDTTRGGNFARAMQAKVFTTDLDEILNDPECNMVVISTRHHEHTEQTIKALKSGKHVFVEKPLAISWDQLEKFLEEYNKLENPPKLMVGFNRRFSPAIQRLVDELKNRQGPVMINYRINGGYISTEHWIQGEHGGGRNIGEACHMYDVFRFISGKPVTIIQALSISPTCKDVLKNDNFIATLRYEDGSIGNLLYTSSGPKQGLPKERIEVFCDGNAYIVDDFKKLIKAGIETPLWESLETDKGHFEELKRFGDSIIEGKNSLISVDEIIETTAVSLHIEDLIFERIQ